jgi:hypothetical protein
MDNLAGELDNYEKNLEGLTRYPGALRDLGEGYTKNFGAFGAAAMVLPGEDLLEYCALRFAAQAVRSQITFGVDRAAATDDRARALARLAVDYADPSFQRMADEGREKVINDSFAASVQELKRQDANEELLDGYWYRLAEAVDEGPVTGTDEKGETLRGETLMARVERRLAEARRALINRVSIKDRSMFFPRQGVSAYIDYIAKLEEEVRLGHQLVDAERPALQRAASEGEPIVDLKLDPIAERYLVVRLLDVCSREWIPQAEQQYEATRRSDLIENPAVRKRLREEIYDSLQRAASSRRLFNRDQEFEQVKQEAQAEYTKTRSAALNLLDAGVRLAQLRALLEYLRRRSRQYVRLATRMDTLVKDLDAEAERLRTGERSRVPPLALRVEVLETLDEPRRRLWDQVYPALFLDGGRYLATFDRQVLSRTISEELKPVVRGDGRVMEKTVDQTVADLRRALTALGRARLAPRILGGEGQSGLDIEGGLGLEARLVLQPEQGEGGEVGEARIDAYKLKKYRALGQVAGLLARVDSAESKALDDGVIVNRTRQLIVGPAGNAGGRGAETARERLVDILSAGGRQVKVDTWHDPRLIVVHDVELPIPLYYFSPITDEIEDAYLDVAANERRGYHLHTDFHWEKSLPNLNPRRSELAVGWALKTFADGLVAGVFSYEDGVGAWAWHRTGTTKTWPLHAGLSGTLYQIGEIHGRDELRADLEGQIEDTLAGLGAEELARRRSDTAVAFKDIVNEVNLHELGGDMGRDDYLDRPILRALIRELGEASASDRRGPGAAPGSRYGQRFGRPAE